MADDVGGTKSWIDVPPVPLPGWLVDPHNPSRHRWWDGSNWTQTIAEGGVVGWDPTSLEPARLEPPGVRGLGVAATGYVVGVAAAIAILLGARAAGFQRSGPVSVAASECGLWAGLLGACVYVTWRRGSRSFGSDFGWSARPVDLGIGVLASLAARLLAVSAVSPFAWAFKERPTSSRGLFDGLLHTPAGWAVLVIVLCVGAPLVEEVFFRGLVQTRLVGRYGPVVGIGVSSVLFGAAHLIGWQGPITLLQVVAVSAAGLVFGVVRYLTGRLGTSIAAHAFFNAQVVILLAGLSTR